MPNLALFLAFFFFFEMSLRFLTRWVAFRHFRPKFFIGHR